MDVAMKMIKLAVILAVIVVITQSQTCGIENVQCMEILLAPLLEAEIEFSFNTSCRFIFIALLFPNLQKEFSIHLSCRTWKESQYKKC